MSMPEGKGNEGETKEKRVSFDLSNLESSRRAAYAHQAKVRPKLTRQSKATASSLSSGSLPTPRGEQKLDVEIKRDVSSKDVANESPKKTRHMPNTRPGSWSASKLPTRPSEKAGSQTGGEIVSTSDAAVAHSLPSLIPVSNLTELQSTIETKPLVGVLFAPSSTGDPQNHLLLEELSKIERITLLEVKAAALIPSDFEAMIQAYGVTSLPTLLIFKTGTLSYRWLHPKPEAIVKIFQGI